MQIARSNEHLSEEEKVKRCRIGLRSTEIRRGSICDRVHFTSAISPQCVPDVARKTPPPLKFGVGSFGPGNTCMESNKEEEEEDESLEIGV